MIELLSFILFFSLILFLIIYFFIKIKYGFWAIQPVFHIYDIGYMINPPGIINKYLPNKNKYTNFKNIETINFSNITDLQIQRLVNLITLNYLKNNDNVFIPKRENIVSYLISHNDKVFISFYNEKYNLIDNKSKNIIIDKKIIGTMTSRPINININNINVNFKGYYVDYLCVDKLYRKKGIAPQLIETHHYNQRILNKNIVVSLFKREDELTGIVPLCVYTTYGFSVTTWRKPNNLTSKYKLLEINKQNFHYLFIFLKENNNKFDIVINSEVTNIIQLIKSNNIFIYTIIEDNNIVCAFFFRKTCIQIEKNIEVLSCFASINNTNNNIFIQGFKISFWKIANENNFGFCAIEEISDNYIIIENIKEKTNPLIKSPTAYFFYNFAYPTFESKKVLIIN